MKFKVAYLVYYIVGMVLLGLGSIIVIPIINNAGSDFAVVPFAISMAVVVIGTFAAIWFSFKILGGRFTKAKADIALLLGDVSEKLTYPDSNQLVLKGELDGVETEVVYSPIGVYGGRLPYYWWTYKGVTLTYVRANIEQVPESEVQAIKGAWEGHTAKYEGKVDVTDKWITWKPDTAPREAAGSLVKQLVAEINKRTGRQ